MTNPYEHINQRFDKIESLIREIQESQTYPAYPKPDQRLSRREVREQYNISYATIHSLMRGGNLPYEKIGRKTVFRSQDVEDYFKGNRKGGGCK